MVEQKYAGVFVFDSLSSGERQLAYKDTKNLSGTNILNYFFHKTIRFHTKCGTKVS